MDLIALGTKAKRASKVLAMTPTLQKRQTLQFLAKELLEREEEILKANHKDILEGKEKGLNEALIDRLSLQGGRLKAISADVMKIALLPDPVGEVFESKTLPNGLYLEKRRVALGVLGVIYESRPNVTVDVAALAIMTGNAAILRGGTETLHSNQALISIIKDVLAANELPSDAIQFIEDSDRKYVLEMLKLHDFVDLIIPRGGATLHKFCRDHSTIPVITGGIGICHLFVDETADLAKAIRVIFNAKTQRPTVCNALDTVLIHEKIIQQFLPMLIEALAKAGVHFRFDAKSWNLLNEKERSLGTLAQNKDWDTEWLSLVLGVKQVKDLKEALEHIFSHSSGHSDGILTDTPSHADMFIQAVDSAAVYVNASTRFTDGGEFGLGAEVAVSTQKLHARGPMGLKELTSYKWVIQGDYHTRG